MLKKGDKMDISRHLNLIKKYGYKGKIGVVKETINGIVLAAARPGQVVLFRPYEVRENESAEVQEYDRTHCSIEFPYSEEQIQKNLSEHNGIKTFATCVGVPLSMIEEIVID